MQLAKEGRIILDLEDLVETNHVFFQPRELCTLQFGNLEFVILLEPELLNSNMQERSFPVNFPEKTMVNMTLCSEVEEEMNEEGSSKENCLGETDNTVATLEAMPIDLN